MNQLRIICLSTSLLVCTSAFAWQDKNSDDRWESGWEQGIAEARVTRGAGNSIYVACDDGSNSGHSATVELIGRKAPPSSDVQLIFDHGDPISVQVGSDGWITTKDRASQSNFETLLGGLRSHKTVYVRFSDGINATFSLNGAGKATSACKSV